MLAFLKYCRLLFGIRNIHFKGGLVSDHSHVFTNIFEISFPSSLRMQCFTHIIRKFTTTQKGNGAYTKYTSAKYLKNVAADDVRNLHKCGSHSMFRAYAEMIREAWTKDNETKLWQCFSDSYVKDDIFNQWFIRCSGIPGCLPFNNSQERSNLDVKGSPKQSALCKIGRTVDSMLRGEFPKMIHSLSRTRVSLEREMMIDHESVVLHHHSKIRKELIQYYNSYNAKCDSQFISPNQKSCRSWWVNSKDTLGQPITSQRIEDFLDALNGTTSYTYGDRHKFVKSFTDLCIVTEKKLLDGRTVFRGSCNTFYHQTCCDHAAVFQYQSQLQLHGCQIPTRRRGQATYQKTSTRNQALEHIKARYNEVSVVQFDINKMILSNAHYGLELTNKISEIPYLLKYINGLQKLSYTKLQIRSEEVDVARLHVSNLIHELETINFQPYLALRSATALFEIINKMVQ